MMVPAAPAMIASASSSRPMAAMSPVSSTNRHTASTLGPIDPAGNGSRRSAPGVIREIGSASGVPKWRTITKVVVPTALPGIVTGVMLGVARVMGETAPILLVVSYVAYINPDPFSGVQGQATLPTVIYNTFQSTEKASNDRTWSAALLLIIIIMLLNIIARLIAWWKKPGRA